MDQTHIAISVFFVLFVVILPLIISKYKIKDDIKMHGTLPVGTAQFRAFLKLVKWVGIGFLALCLFVWLFQ